MPIIELGDEVVNDFRTDDHGRPAGGKSESKWLRVDWQDGPIGKYGRNGAVIEDLVNLAIARLEFYQDSDFASTENREAINALARARMFLDSRTADRVRRGVEGTYEL